MLQGNKELSQVCQRYRARVFRITPKHNHYLIETNRGPKELHVWPRVDVLRWSFLWREQMARQGYRDVERFIRTRDAKPYVVLGKTGFSLTDHLRRADSYSPSAEHARICGQAVARMHRAQSAQPFPPTDDLFSREQSHAVGEMNRARELYDAFRSRKAFPDETDKWVASQFVPLLERMKRSVELIHSPLIVRDRLAVSHSDLGRENWALVGGRLILRGFYRPALSVQQRDTARFLRQLYLEKQDMSIVDAFLDGYEEHKPLRYDEYVLLLAFMAFPRRAWETVERLAVQSLKGEPTDREEQTEHLHQRLLEQQAVDRLLAHIAHRAERARRGSGI